MYGYNMNNGYFGFSMSNRAVEAYEDGEMPLSKWTKAEMIERAEELIEEYEITLHCDFEKVKKLCAPELKEYLLHHSSWHHTSKCCNETDFYEIDLDWLEQVTDEELDRIAEEAKIKREQAKSVEKRSVKYRGDLFYSEWYNKGRTCYDYCLKDVNIEEKGCFYIATDDDGYVKMRKKIGGRGTYTKRFLAENGEEKKLSSDHEIFPTYFDECEKQYIGKARRAQLKCVGLVNGERTDFRLCFPRTNMPTFYYAYFIDDYTRVGVGFTPVFECEHRLEIYDDKGLAFSEAGRKFKVYRNKKGETIIRRYGYPNECETEMTCNAWKKAEMLKEAEKLVKENAITLHCDFEKVKKFHIPELQRLLLAKCDGYKHCCTKHFKVDIGRLAEVTDDELDKIVEQVKLIKQAKTGEKLWDKYEILKLTFKQALARGFQLVDRYANPYPKNASEFIKCVRTIDGEKSYVLVQDSFYHCYAVQFEADCN